MNNPKYPTKFIRQCFYIWWRAVLGHVMVMVGLAVLLMIGTGLITLMQEISNSPDPQMEQLEK